MGWLISVKNIRQLNCSGLYMILTHLIGLSSSGEIALSAMEAGGYTYAPHLIAFASLPQSFYPSGIKTPEMAYRQAVNNVVHELGHAFALLWAHNGGYDNSGPYGTGIIPGELVDNDGFYLYPGPEGASLTWRQHPCIAGDDNCSHEVFADMFLGWTYGAWANNREGQERSNFMMQHMPAWIVSLVP